MPFFENATNFKVTGGTFNVVAGDLNRHDHYYSNFTSNTYSDYPEDISNHQYYDPYAEWSPRGRHPAHHRSQRRQQEQGPYGYAEYYDDRQSESQGYYEGGYEGYEPPPPHRFESSLHSPRHVEITGGEFTQARNWNATQHYRPDAPRSFVHESEGTEFSPTHSSRPHVDLNRFHPADLAC
jgi:hypothetical protein